MSGLFGIANIEFYIIGSLERKEIGSSGFILSLFVRVDIVQILKVGNSPKDGKTVSPEESLKILGLHFRTCRHSDFRTFFMPHPWPTLPSAY